MKAFRKAAALFMVAAIVMTMAAVPAKVQAAAGAPAKVTQALKKAVDENGRTIVIDHQGERMYLFKKNKSGKWELKKSFRCVCGDYLRPDRHYHLLRNADTDKLTYKEGARLYSYGVYIDCYETAPTRAIRIHSYAEIGGRVYKNGKKNNSGFAVCIDNAAYIWRYYSDGTAVMGV